MNSSQANLDLLAARVQKLEVSNHRWKLLSALLLLSIVSVVVMGAKPADRIELPIIHATSVEAQQFVLKNENGRVFAVLTTNPTPKLDHNSRWFAPSEDPATLRFYDEEGHLIWTAPPDHTVVPAR